jgi:hypothetical protein
MKVIGNFTQTYQGKDNWSPGNDGKDRSFLVESMLRDKNQVKIRNMLDYHTYTFHNMDKQKSIELADKIKKEIPKTDFFQYNNMYFMDTIKIHLHHLRSKGVTDVLWLQDDEFFVGDYDNFKLLLDFYKKNNDILHVNLLNYFPENRNANQFDQFKIKLSDDLWIYNLNAEHWILDKKLAMDFSACIFNLDYLLDKIYTNSFFLKKITDVYQLEGTVHEIAKIQNIQRYSVNTSFFGSFNIVGMIPSTWDAERGKVKLEELLAKQ